jgi:hypothetical protein
MVEAVEDGGEIVPSQLFGGDTAATIYRVSI